MSDRYVVIGHPIAHSRSPAIHAMFSRQTSEDILYDSLLAPLDGFERAVREFISAGGCGANVTLPFKVEAFELADEASERANHARAANTLRFSDGRIFADNTDGVGLVRDITANLGFQLAGKRLLLLGAGGAARGVLLPLLQTRPACLAIANRTADKASQLAQSNRDHALAAATEIFGLGLDELGGEQFELVINATSTSLGDQRLTLPENLFAPDAMAYDMMYGKGLTPFLGFAEERSVERLADGLGMLVEQAAESFLIWRGLRPETQSVIHALRQQS